MKRQRYSQVGTKTQCKPSHEGKSDIDEQVDLKMRLIANHFIDRLLEIQEESAKKGLNINKEKAILIMEHRIKQI